LSRRLPDDWFPCDLPAGLEIGSRCYLGSSYAFLHTAPTATIRIGNDTGIYHGTAFELGVTAQVTIGNYGTLVGPILRVESELHIGDYVLIAHGVVITDCESLEGGRHQSPRPITIGDDVWIGVRSIILAGVSIGSGAVVGAGALVCEDVPAMTIVAGNPARVVRRIAA
jgi:acetyltransferase-like isoleucine patch superfamily enzyme